MTLETALDIVFMGVKQGLIQTAGDWGCGPWADERTSKFPGLF